MKEALNLLGGGWAWVFETSWQASVLVGLILGVQWLFRKHLSPAWRDRLWFLLLLRLITPSLPESPLSLFNVGKANWLAVSSGDEGIPVMNHKPLGEIPYEGWMDVSRELPGLSEIQRVGMEAGTSLSMASEGRPLADEAAIYEEVGREGVKWFLGWREMVSGIWVLGVVVFLVRLGYVHTKFLKQVGRGKRVEDSRLLRLLEEGRARIGVKCSLVVLETEVVVAPAVCGFFRKKLLLPRGFADRFSDKELRCILYHELSHIKRGDIEMNWIASLLQIIHWFNPIIRLGFSRMRLDRIFLRLVSSRSYVNHS